MYHLTAKPKLSISFLVMIFLSIVYGALANTEKGFLAHYNFSHGKGDVLYDKSGNGNHGTIHGATWIKEKNRNVLKFDGSGDYIDLGNVSDLDITGDITIAIWLKLTVPVFDFPTNVTNWTIVDCETHNKSGYILRVAGDTAKLTYRSNQTGANQVANSMKMMENNCDYHIVITKTKGRVQYFINAYPGISSPVKNPAPADASLKISNPAQSFNGLIYDFKIYDHAMTNQDIMGLYKKESSDYQVDPSWASIHTPTHSTQTEIQTRPNLALPKNSAWVISSSNGDFFSMYSENLIDDNLNTTWRSYQKTNEEWIELKWDFEMLLNKLIVYQHELSRVSSMELYAWKRDKLVLIDKKDLADCKGGKPLEFSFDTIETKRLRILMRNDSPRYTGLREIQAYGPDQPILALTLARYLKNELSSMLTAYPGFAGGLKWSYVSADRFQPKGSQESLILGRCSIEPAYPKPGTDIKLTLKLKPTVKLADDYAMVITIGQREYDFQRSDYSITRNILRPDTPTSKWPANKTQTIEANIYIPKHAPHGKLDVMLHTAGLKTHPPLKLVNMKSEEIIDGKIAKIDIRRFDKTPKPDKQIHTTRIDTSNGTVIEIDGKKVPPLLFALQTPSFERNHYYTQDAGIKLYHLQIYPFRIYDGDYQQRNYNFVAGHIENMLRIDPQAYVIIQMDLRTSGSWQQANPDGCLYTHDGRRMHESFASKEYRDEVVSYLTNLVKFVKGKPWGNRVIGYLCELGEPEGVLSGAPDIGDYNPQAIEAFRKFVRKKYDNSPAKLQKAYNDPALTFEKVYPTYSKIIEDGANGGCFLDPATQRLAIDYHEFVASLVPSFLMEYCAGTIKRLTNNRVLVGSYWAYLLEDLNYGQASHQITHSYLDKVLESPNLDFFASPFNYWHPARHAGDPYLTFQPYDALRINGKLHIPECDHRTFRNGAFERGRNYSREETLSVMKRDLGTAIMHGMGAWFSDWTNNDSDNRRLSEPFFLDDQILGQISVLREKYEETIELKREKATRIAVLVSGTSYYYHDNNAQPIYTDIIRQTLYFNMNMIGAPYDVLLLEDIQKPSVQDDYDCYIFLNAFYMTEKQRQIVEKLKRAGGNTLVWTYAPGYAGKENLSTANIEKITGFKVQADYNPQPLSYTLTDQKHPITMGVENLKYGGRAGNVSPRFYITDESRNVKVLGKYHDGKAALVAKDFRRYKSIYCAVPYFSIEMLRNIVKYAGCHVYVDNEIYMDATKDFLMLTNSFTGKRNLKVKLPEKCDIQDLITDAPIASDVRSFNVEMEPGQTLLYRLK